jgi:hypothetical protein
VHFTREGYQKVADLIIDDLLKAAQQSAPRAGAAVAEDNDIDEDIVPGPPPTPSSPPTPPTPSSPTLPTLTATPAGKTASLAAMEEAPRALP